jgi:ribonuclease HI
VTDSANPSFDLAALDALSGGAFSANQASERVNLLRDWLAKHPSLAELQAAYDEMSHRDKGAAKLLRERLDELRKSQDQDALVQEWAAKGQALCDAAHVPVADALAWQRDAAKAGAPLSREPLASLKAALTERVKAVEDLQHQTQVHCEAAVLLAQRIDVLSTKPWQDALAQREALQADVARWETQAQSLQTHAHWSSVDAKIASHLQTNTQQVQAVWLAFGEALTLTQAAAADPAAPLPAVPAWSDEIRVARGEVLPQAAAPAVGVDTTRKLKPTADKAVVDAKRLALVEQAEALFKPAATKPQAKAAAPAAEPVAETVAESMADVPTEPVADTPTSAVGEEGVTPVAEAAPAPAAAVPTAGAAPELVPVMTGRKLQEALRNLREQWKKIDKEAAPNPGLWKRFDTACNRAHTVVEAWLKESRAQSNANKAQRMALIEEVKTWAAAHANGPDWKAVARQLHQFAQRWRDGGHLSEKMFAQLQPLWKEAIHAAHEPLETAQKASMARRQALIAEAQALAQAPSLRVDAVKALQQRWQDEAHTVALDRKHEQKLWDAFRQPLDQAFTRKASARDAAQTALTPHDKAVVDAAKALEAASAKGDAAEIRAAMQALENAMHAPANGTPAASAAASAAADKAQEPASAEVTPETSAEPVAASDVDAADEAAVSDTPVADAPAAPAPKAAPRPVVAVRGDDRPGQKRPDAQAAQGRGRDGQGGKFGNKFGDKAGDRGRPGREAGRDGKPFEPRAPRLGDAAFRAQRHAMTSAQEALRRLAAHAHGEVLTQVLHAWQKRDAAQLPAAQALGSKLSPAQRTQWAQALSAPAAGDAATALLRLEVAADLPTPAAQHDARRALQLQLLTRRNDPSPQMTWATDAAQVLAGAHDEGAARRLQAALKVLLKR